MRKGLGMLALTVWLALPAAAQEAPKVEWFAGYSFGSFETGAGLDRLSLHGWNTSLAGNVNGWLGAVADFSGSYGSPGGVQRKVHSFLFGPRLAYRGNGRATPFVHALFGATRARRDMFDLGIPPPAIPARAETAFSMALGGGLDLRATDAVAFRVAQLDALITRFEESTGIVCVQSIATPCPTTQTGTQHNLRFSAGIVLRFGR